mgnify:CR=1 FL=1
MTSNKILLICLAFIALTACNAGSKRQTNHHMENEKRTLVKLETTMGNIQWPCIMKRRNIVITLSNW